MDKEITLIELIEKKNEDDQVDYKKEFYPINKTHDLIKDVQSFANNINFNEKYIIFGIDDSFNLHGVNYLDVRDISEINQIINEYCEPFINIELYRFRHKGYNLLSMIIKSMQRPYVIKKDYSKNGGTLKKGDIFIRKGATNFKALLDDLDAIYENRSKINLVNSNDFLYIDSIHHGRQFSTMCYFDVFIDNMTKRSILIKEAKIQLIYSKNSIGLQVLYIEELSLNYKKELQNIRYSLVQIEEYKQYKRRIFSEITKELIDSIKSFRDLGNLPSIRLTLVDASNNNIISEFDVKDIIVKI